MSLLSHYGKTANSFLLNYLSLYMRYEVSHLFFPSWHWAYFSLLHSKYSIHSPCLMKLRSYPCILNQIIIHICIKHILRIKTGQEDECLWKHYLYCPCPTTQAMRNRFINIFIHIKLRNKINYFTTKEEGHPGLNSLVKINGREK